MKFISVIALSCILFSTAAISQAVDPKLEWATKAVALQQGPELDRLIGQLAESASQDILQNWITKLRSDVPKARQEQAAESLNLELKKFYDDVSKTIKSKVGKVSTETLIPAYMEKFSLDELKQLVAFFESPVIKKYQTVSPELGSIFVGQLVSETRAEVALRGNQFEIAAVKIVGVAPVPKSTTPNSGASKPAVKK